MHFGLETELALTGRIAGGGPASMDVLLTHFERAARECLLHVPDGRGSEGFFMTNGARFYRDPTYHSEFCTPEVDHPDEIVRQSAWAETALHHVATVGQEVSGMENMIVSNINYCYASSQSFGSHENFSPSGAAAEQMIPFLATRPFFSGSGGFDTKSPGIEFTLSPRIHFCTHDKSEGTQAGSRGLFNTKSGGLSRVRRLHVITGEGSRSEWSMWMKFALTALVTEIFSSGAKLPDEAKLVQPVRAATRFARDTGFTARAKTADGKLRSALDIQESYLHLVEGRLRYLPDWAVPACERWREVLETLRSGAGWRGLTTRLDWAIKRGLVFESHLERSGWSWGKIEAFNEVVASVRARLREASGGTLPDSPNIFAPSPLLTEVIDALGVDRARLESFWKLRQELFELDLRYHQFGPDSLFQVLDRAGCLQHRVVDGPAAGYDPLDAPAPPSGRAALRGALVRENGVRGDRACSFVAGWTFFDDRNARRRIEMPDADSSERTWKVIDAEQPRRRGGRLPGSDEAGHAMGAYRDAMRIASGSLRNGGVEAAAAALRNSLIRAAVANLSPGEIALYWQSLARVHARCQNAPETLAALDRLEQVVSGGRLETEAVCDQAALRCLLTLSTHESAAEWMPRAEALLASDPRQPEAQGKYLRSQLAMAANRMGDPERACSLLEPYFDGLRACHSLPLIRGRSEIAMAEAIRLSRAPNHERARELVRNAVEDYRRLNLDGPLADYGYLHHAKIEAAGGHPATGLEILAEARRLQGRLNNPNLLRTILLQVRIDATLDAAARQQLRGEAEAVVGERSGFRQCPRVDHILRNWNDWCSGADDAAPLGVADQFWGV